MKQRRLGFWLRFAVVVLEPLLLAFTKRDWKGLENIPSSGGCVLVPNHLSHLDPLTLGHVVYRAGRSPRFLAKAGLFSVPFVGRVVRGAGQIPVDRESRDASSAYAAAVAAVREGELVIIYPEATLTRDPALWPMTGKTGAARVALATGAPIIPVAQWGPQEILAPYTKRPHLLPRKTISVRVGRQLDLRRFGRERPDVNGSGGEPLDVEVLKAATDAILDAIAALLAEIRGVPAPATRFDASGLPQRRPFGTGSP